MDTSLRLLDTTSNYLSPKQRNKHNRHLDSLQAIIFSVAKLLAWLLLNSHTSKNSLSFIQYEPKERRLRLDSRKNPELVSLSCYTVLSNQRRRLQHFRTPLSRQLETAIIISNVLCFSLTRRIQIPTNESKIKNACWFTYSLRRCVRLQ